MDTIDSWKLWTGLDRLSSYDRGTLALGSIASPVYSQDWNTLDSLGNWRSFTDNGAGQTRAHNAANEIIGITGGGVSPIYDTAGNMTSGPRADNPATRQHLAYDGWGRLVKAYNDSGGSPGSLLAAYAYDGQGRRISKTTGGNTDDFYYNEGWQLLETRRNGDPDAREQYIWDIEYIDTPSSAFAMKTPTAATPTPPTTPCTTRRTPTTASPGCSMPPERMWNTTATPHTASQACTMGTGARYPAARRWTTRSSSGGTTATRRPGRTTPEAGTTTPRWGGGGRETSPGMLMG